jgi:hypothetical protein
MVCYLILCFMWGVRVTNSPSITGDGLLQEFEFEA